MTNELHLETSPYLLQHANNPINWKAYNHHAFEQAKQQNKLVVISIGYSTCHWCHVMEHESFEDLQVARVMNQNYISVKVDREEFPDVDNYYMKAVQLMTKQGGWPLNVVCLPDGRPIWGGTYFNKQSWIDSLEQLHNLYENNPQTTIEFAQKLEQGVSILSKGPVLDQNARFNLDLLLDKWSKSFDWEFGGYTRSPKFMMPNNLLYLQRLALVKHDENLLNYVDLTLTKMAWGGIFDPIEGGFCRYSVDYKWHIAHFEKMLYDNAQLLSLYSDAYKRTSNDLYRWVIEKTIEFLTQNFKDKSKGFFSALDADSLNKENELEEGAYYCWTKQELEQILDKEFDLFAQVFNINEYGYWQDDLYVLIQNKSLQEIAQDNNITYRELTQRKSNWEKTLKQHKIQRPQPRLDHKIITSWNAMLIVGLLDSYTALKDPSLLQLAQDTFDFIYQNLYQHDKGLYHCYIKGTKKAEAYLDDYAFLIQGCLSLHQHTANTKYLDIAKNLTDLTLDEFWDSSSGFFYFSKQANHAVLKSIETEDNVIVSCNSVMAQNLIALGILYQNYHYTKIANHMVQVILSQIDYPSAYSNWLLAQLYLDNPCELVITGKESLAKVLEIREKPISRTLIYAVNQDTDIPYLNKPIAKENLSYYFCEQQNCLSMQSDADFLNAKDL